MPTYRNISNSTYVNTKYNIFGIEPGQEFTIDKEINSSSLQKISDDPPVKYEGDQIITLNPGDEVTFDLTDKIEVAVYPESITDPDYVEIGINQSPTILGDTLSLRITSSNYYNEKYLQLKEYNTLYLLAPNTNTNPTTLRIVYKFK